MARARQDLRVRIPSYTKTTSFRNDVVHYDLFWRRNEKRVRDSSRTEASTVPVRWMALFCSCGIETSDSRAFRVDAYISCGGLW